MFMQRFATGSRGRWYGRASRATVAALLLTSGVFVGLPPASAISPPTIDPAAVPPDGPPGPPAPMKQNSYCTEVGVLPGTDFRLQPKYMLMLYTRGGGATACRTATPTAPSWRR